MLEMSLIHDVTSIIKIQLSTYIKCVLRFSFYSSIIYDNLFSVVGIERESNVL